MKKKLSMRIASCLLIALLMTTCLTSGTFAKYTSSSTANDAARVAKWSFTVGDGNNIGATKTFAFDLFETIKDTVLQDGALVPDADVRSDKIAPGTQGSFDLVMTNTSEVLSRVKIGFDWNGLDEYITFQYSVVDSENAPMADTDGYYPVPIGKTITCKVTWVWPYHTTTDQDTADSTVGAKPLEGRQFAVTATVKAEQVD